MTHEGSLKDKRSHTRIPHVSGIVKTAFENSIYILLSLLSFKPPWCVLPQ